MVFWEATKLGEVVSAFIGLSLLDEPPG